MPDAANNPCDSCAFRKGVQVKGRFIPIGGELTDRVRLCAGWKREVARLKRRGDFAGLPEARQLQIKLGNFALASIKQFVDAPVGSDEKKEHLANLRAATE